MHICVCLVGHINVSELSCSNKMLTRSMYMKLCFCLLRVRRCVFCILLTIIYHRYARQETCGSNLLAPATVQSIYSGFFVVLSLQDAHVTHVLCSIKTCQSVVNG